MFESFSQATRLWRPAGRSSRAVPPLLTISLACACWLAGSPAWALIIGGTGNDPLPDPGWPAGAAAVFNTPARVAYWEGPPFGGGQSHAECRGDAAAFSAVLADFAKVDVTPRRVIVRDGVGHSVWLRGDDVSDKLDWVFVVWQADRLKFQGELPVGLRSMVDPDSIQLAQLEVFVGGAIKWEDVQLPEGIELVDERLSAHGFTPANGTVLEGVMTDCVSGNPVAGRVRLEEVLPQPTGGYTYPVLQEVAADEQGKWVITQAPAKWYRIVIGAAGYVDRVIGHQQGTSEPAWSQHHGSLARPATAAGVVVSTAGVGSGRVTSPAGTPLAEVTVRIDDLSLPNGERYETAVETTAQTDVRGRFEVTGLPVGKGSVWLQKPGYARPGLGQQIELPADQIELTMIPAANLNVRVQFASGTPPAGYIVMIEPEGGSVVGSWGGSAQLDPQQEVHFTVIPPGKYVVTGRPNPGSEDETSPPVTIELTGGETTDLVLPAR